MKILESTFSNIPQPITMLPWCTLINGGVYDKSTFTPVPFSSINTNRTYNGDLCFETGVRLGCFPTYKATSTVDLDNNIFFDFNTAQYGMKNFKVYSYDPITQNVSIYPADGSTTTSLSLASTNILSEDENYFYTIVEAKDLTQIHRISKTEPYDVLSHTNSNSYPRYNLFLETESDFYFSVFQSASTSYNHIYKIQKSTFTLTNLGSINLGVGLSSSNAFKNIRMFAKPKEELSWYTFAAVKSNISFKQSTFNDNNLNAFTTIDLVIDDFPLTQTYSSYDYGFDIYNYDDINGIEYIVMIYYRKNLNTSAFPSTILIYKREDNNLILHHQYKSLMNNYFPYQDMIIFDEVQSLTILKWNPVTAIYDIVNTIPTGTLYEYGFDSDGIFWYSSSEGCTQLKFNQPTSIQIKLKDDRYYYKEEPINTSFQIISTNYLGEQINATLKLYIEGNAIFENGTNELTLQVSGNTLTEVPLIITGAGKFSINLLK